MQVVVGEIAEIVQDAAPAIQTVGIVGGYLFGKTVLGAAEVVLDAAD